MNIYVLLFLSVVFLSQTHQLNAQTGPDSSGKFQIIMPPDPPDYRTLYNYSTMGDTLIYKHGYTYNGEVFTDESSDSPEDYFASRTITIRNGKLREVFISDSNFGLETTITYNEKGEMKKEQRVNKKIVTNAPIKAYTGPGQLDYENLYDYSKMKDTVISQSGSYNGVRFQPKEDMDFGCFAIQKIIIRKGKLKKVHIIPTNGLETIILYDTKRKKGKKKI